MLNVEALTKTFVRMGESINALDSVSIDVNDREWVTLLGPSGCGKTTTLRSVAGLEEPGSGVITIGNATVYSSSTGIAVPVNKRPISMVFQSYAIWPHLTVYQNVSFPLEASGGLDKAAIRRKVMQVLEMVGMERSAGHSATQLSGGQQQRVAIARAIVKESKLLLLDEPLSNLDAKLRLGMRDELRRLHDELGTTTLYVTHDQDEALALSDRIVLMNDGRVVEEGAPRDLYLRPARTFTASFLGSAESWECLEVEVRGDVALGHTADGVFSATSFPANAVGEPCAFVIRPEHIRMERPDHGDPSTVGALPAVVERMIFGGKSVDYVVRTKNDRILHVAQPATAAWRVGDDVTLTFPPELSVICAM